MASVSLSRWQTAANASLDELVQAHQALVTRGVGPGQLNQAFAVMLSSHFQGFCRDLHTEAVDCLCDHLTDPWVVSIFRERFIQGRKLDIGNPTPANLGNDFSRFGMSVAEAMEVRNPDWAVHKRDLELFFRWRNAIAHADFASTSELSFGNGRILLEFGDVLRWWGRCGDLALGLDRAVGDHLSLLVGRPSW